MSGIASCMQKGAAADVRIGVSGWTYRPWRGAFYPDGLPQARELAHASRVFRSIEINGTFYGLQRPDVFARWANETPDDFLFAVKAPRFITHVKRLREPLRPLANFFASGLLRLGPKLGPILWQFPPNFRFEAKLMEDFLRLLPHEPAEAETLARKHDHRLNGRAALSAKGCPPLRHAIEIRNESFVDPAFIAMLREHGVALVCADTVEWPRLMDTTSTFAYCRLHGSEELYRSGYSDAQLARWSRLAKAWAAGHRVKDGRFAAPQEPDPPPRDVFIFFDNTDKLRAPDDARTLMRKLGQEPGPSMEVE